MLLLMCSCDHNLHRGLTYQGLFGLPGVHLTVQLRRQHTRQQAADLWALWYAKAFEINSGQVWSDVTPRREIVSDALVHCTPRAEGK
jgi:hypothetical protein